MTLKHTPVKLAIIGGGAAGMFAAAVAAERRLPAVLIERKARIGSKVLMTANGRCNFTKDIAADEFLRDLECAADTSTREFTTPAIRECPPHKIIQGFKSLGVPLRRMADGRMFPADGRAATIVHAFGDLLRDSETPVFTNCAVTGIQPQRNGFIVATKNFTLWAENILLATGGISYPKLGSVGDGQKFACELGHRLVPYRPGLIGLETDDPRVVKRAGRRFEDGYARVFASASAGPRPLFDYHGEVDCESFGLSGAAIYNAQRFIEHYLRQTASQSADERRLRAALTIEVGFDRERLSFQGLSPRPVKEAIVTIGGVSLDDVNPETMESRKVPHLYFAGEVLDIDGPTGGYNLTLAFATARKAVASIPLTGKPDGREPPRRRDGV
ncbi:MAG: NAD(P)/FAD-dependent oxidoreductase [Kiritimatiellia bacterium]